MIRRIYLQSHHLWHDNNYFGEYDRFSCPRCKKSIGLIAQDVGDGDMIVIYIGKTHREIETHLKKEMEIE